MDPHDEERHDPGPDSDHWWCETFVFDLWSVDGSLGAFTWLTLLPNQRRAWYWSALVRADAPVLHVADNDLPLPTNGLRVRTAGLWADHHCEVPFEQWTVQNECHAVALDDPADALGRAYGTATPIAFDVEWYATEAAVVRPDGYEQRGEAHAVIEVVGGPLEVVGAGARWHTWGSDRSSPGERQEGGALRAFWRDPTAAVIERTLTRDGWRTSVAD
jgi:hypothetical protein